MKTGQSTSEFRLTALVIIGGFAILLALILTNQTDKIGDLAGIFASFAGVTGLYSAGRSYVKSNA